MLARHPLSILPFPNTIDNVLSNHTKAVHTTLGLEDASKKNAANGYAGLDANKLLDFVTSAITIASDTVMNANDAERSYQVNSSWVKLKEIKLNQALQGVRIYFEIRIYGGTGYTSYGQIYKNGVAIGTLRSNEANQYVGFDEDFSTFAANDLIQIYCRISNPAVAVQVRNMRLKYSINCARSATNQDP